MSTPSTTGMIIACAYCRIEHDGDAPRGPSARRCGCRSGIGSVAGAIRLSPAARAARHRRARRSRSAVAETHGSSSSRLQRLVDRARRPSRLRPRRRPRTARRATRRRRRTRRATLVSHSDAGFHRALGRSACSRARWPARDCGCWPVAKNSASRSSGSPDANTSADSSPSRCSIAAIRSVRTAMPLRSSRSRSRRSSALAVRADHDVGAPRLQPEREAGDGRAAAERRERPVAPFPAVAVRAVKDRSAVAVVEAGDRRQVVDDAGGDQQVARALLGAVRRATRGRSRRRAARR